MPTSEDQVSFGYRTVDAAEKKRLVHDQFTPIAERCDRANTLSSSGSHNPWERAAVRGIQPGTREVRP